jgi:hypothetical protein
MDNTTLRLLASIGLFAVGAALVVAVAALLDRRVKQPPPVRRPSPWLGLISLLVGAWGAVVEYSLRAEGTRGMIGTALWGALIVFGAIRLSKSIGWRPGARGRERASDP